MTPADPPAYVVAGMQPWNRQTFDRTLAAPAGTWRFTATTEEPLGAHRVPVRRAVEHAEAKGRDGTVPPFRHHGGQPEG